MHTTPLPRQPHAQLGLHPGSRLFHYALRLARSDGSLSEIVEPGADGQPPVSFPLGGDIMKQHHIFQGEVPINIEYSLSVCAVSTVIVVVIVIVGGLNGKDNPVN